MTCRATSSALWLAALAVLFCCQPADACNVPVFRYALEQWRPDTYRAVIFHRGPLSESEKECLDPLQERDGSTAANVAFRTIDVDNLESEADRAMFHSLDNPPLPFLVVQFPAPLQIDSPIWSGPLDRAAVERLTESPVRRELVRRLVDGQTAVWLLLESGDAQKDDAAAALLKKEMETQQKTLKLPELTDSVEDTLLTATPLRVEFSLLRVPRDTAEQALVGMLLQSEPDLPERTDPMAFPVFGRGRAMLGLVGKGITAANIRDSAAFLVGACSCQIKEQNPGFDLLLAARWDSLISHEGIPPITSRVESVKEPELVPIPPGSSAPPLTAVDSVRNSELGHSPALSQPVVAGWPIRAELAIVGFIIASGFIALRRLRRNRG
ncbi:MAG: hypothetical protein IT428_12195 [Planctomycetaceae bacterium]|nr:hypothetical protein [Planctomycetaceae bacterium]